MALRLSGNLVDFRKPISVKAVVQEAYPQLSLEVLSEKDSMGKPHLFFAHFPSSHLGPFSSRLFKPRSVTNPRML